jgi:L,D-transpeptidase-like protein
MAVALFVVLTRGEDHPEGTRVDAAGGSGDLLSVLRSTVPLPHFSLGPPPPDKVRGPEFPLARVRPGQRVELRDAPGGRVIARLGHLTEFGSARTFWIARRQGAWFGVPAPELGNGRIGWISDNRTALHLAETHYWIVADTSAHLLELHYGNRVLNRFPVTVGSPGSPTPLGDYSVTDGLAGRAVGPYYGCCILALSGHQPHLPPNWLGGDRIAIHGTPGSIGGASSAGCLRASDRDMVQLFARVPLGAPVFIRG